MRCEEEKTRQERRRNERLTGSDRALRQKSKRVESSHELTGQIVNTTADAKPEAKQLNEGKPNGLRTTSGPEWAD